MAAVQGAVCLSITGIRYQILPFIVHLGFLQFTINLICETFIRESFLHNLSSNITIIYKALDKRGYLMIIEG